VGKAVLVIPEGKTIFEAIKERTGRVEVTDVAENYSLSKLRDINKKSRGLENVRHLFPGHTFPSLSESALPSTIAA
jgi:hypothetical protein